MSAVTINNAKIFLQLMSKSRRLIKINEKEAATIISLRNYRLKTRF